METQATHIETILNKAADYAETKIEIVKLRTAGKISETISSIMSVTAFVLIVVFALGIMSIGVSLWVCSYFKHAFYGFFITGGFYTLVGLILFAFRKKLIKKPISNLIIDRLIK